MAEELKNYYFTYSSDPEAGMPHIGGWTIVKAHNPHEANLIWRCAFPNYISGEGYLKCAGIYGEDSFQNTAMSKRGNYGRFAWEVIELKVNVLVNDDGGEEYGKA